MIPACGVTFRELDHADIVESGDELMVFLTMSDGSTVATLLPVVELIRRGRVIVGAADAPALYVVPALQ
jgi:hypothetical protein